MTRAEFDRLFAATHDNTTGTYTDAQLAEINRRMFEGLADMDADDDRAKSYADLLFDRAVFAVGG